MESGQDFHTARALLEWQIELGATEAVGDVTVDRFALPDPIPSPKSGLVQSAADQPAEPQTIAAVPHNPADVARGMAKTADSLDALRELMKRFDLCDLKKGARNLVFSDGIPGARVMVIGEAPGREEDREGRPFVGRAGQLLDRMLDAIDLSRSENVYITNVLPWRPPQNRDPNTAEIGMMRPFLERHVALAKPDILVVMGNVSCEAVLGKRGITRLRGNWTKAFELPVLPMFHPAYLLRTPSAKREAWADLLELKARLRGG